LIKNGEPDFENDCFKRFMPEAKDLMMKMLIKNPYDRITPAQALEHPYFIKTGHT
jgi:serine/threonine protein kinase